VGACTWADAVPTMVASRQVSGMEAVRGIDGVSTRHSGNGAGDPEFRDAMLLVDVTRNVLDGCQVRRRSLVSLSQRGAALTHYSVFDGTAAAHRQPVPCPSATLGTAVWRTIPSAAERAWLA
jgi:hypothetical protein